MTRSPGPSARVITLAFHPAFVLRARLGDAPVERLAGVVGVFQFRAVQRMQGEIDQRDVGREHHQKEQAEDGEDVPSGQLSGHGLSFSDRRRDVRKARPQRSRQCAAPGMEPFMARRNDRRPTLRSPVFASIAVKVIGVELPGVASGGRRHIDRDFERRVRIDTDA